MDNQEKEQFSDFKTKFRESLNVMMDVTSDCGKTLQAMFPQTPLYFAFIVGDKEHEFLPIVFGNTSTDTLSKLLKELLRMYEDGYAVSLKRGDLVSEINSMRSQEEFNEFINKFLGRMSETDEEGESE